MADQQAPTLPPQLVAALGGNAAGAPPPAAAPPPPPPAMVAVDQQAVCDALMRAIQTCAEKGPGAGDPRETGELAKAALAYAQAYVAIHPGLIAPQGVPPQVMAAAQPAIVPPENNAETAAEGGAETSNDKAAEGNG